MYFRNTPIVGKIENINELVSIDIMNLYAYDSEKENDVTYHQYMNKLPLIEDAFDIIKDGSIKNKIQNHYPNEIIENIDGMNEIYVSVIGSKGSDRVFETLHIDGPFFFLPFCTVLRCVLAIKGNPGVFTEFPSSHISHAILTNEYLAFDYNRDPHFIWKSAKKSDVGPRVLIKLHYLVTPAFLPRPISSFYRNIHVIYNSFMRNSFLASQKKDTVLAKTINYGTILYCFVYKNLNIIGAFAVSGVLLFCACK